VIGFAIRKAFAEFRRVALKDGLADPRNIAHSIRFSNLAGLVLCHLNRICSLLPGEGMTTQWIHSREGIVVIELETNYNWWIPEKLGEVVSVSRSTSTSPRTLSRGGISKMILTKNHRTNISSRVSRQFPAAMRQNF